MPLFSLVLLKSNVTDFFAGSVFFFFSLLWLLLLLLLLLMMTMVSRMPGLPLLSLLAVAVRISGVVSVDASRPTEKSNCDII